MGIEQISSQWYVVRYDASTTIGFVVVDGPYQDPSHAVAQSRIREI